jgi:DNA-directed RNA polymerase subunit H
LKKAKSTLDVLKHSLVPKMEIISENKKKSVLEEYNLNSPLQLPQMYKDDPAAVALGASVGDVIKVERVEPTGKYTAYRVVVD